MCPALPWHGCSVGRVTAGRSLAGTVGAGVQVGTVDEMKAMVLEDGIDGPGLGKEQGRSLMVTLVQVPCSVYFWV